MPNMKFFEINFCFSYRAAHIGKRRRVRVRVQTTGYCAKRDDAFKILPIGHYCLAFNAAPLTALLIDLLIDVAPSLSLCVPLHVFLSHCRWQKIIIRQWQKDFYKQNDQGVEELRRWGAGWIPLTTARWQPSISKKTASLPSSWQNGWWWLKVKLKLKVSMAATLQNLCSLSEFYILSANNYA